MTLKERVEAYLALAAKIIGFEDESATIIREQQAEIERLRKDAERYQFLRSDDVEDTGNLPCVYIANQCGNALVETALDAAVDAAIAKEKEGG